jgi:uncharacterized protein (DUF697 family)
VLIVSIKLHFCLGGIAMSTNKENQARAIILAYATAHATIALILANTIVGDAPILFILTSAMIIQIGDLCGKNIDWESAPTYAANLFGAVAGGYLAGKLITWVPFMGNALNASITFGITQVIGWAVFTMFNEGVSQEEAIRYGRKKQISREEMDSIINNMSSVDRERYNKLISNLKNTNLSDIDRQNIASEMAEIIESYQ